MKNFANPHEHVQSLISDGYELAVITPGDNPRCFKVLSSGPVWVYLVQLRFEREQVGQPYWIRWEDISEFGIRFTTLEVE